MTRKRTTMLDLELSMRVSKAEQDAGYALCEVEAFSRVFYERLHELEQSVRQLERDNDTIRARLRRKK